MRSHEEFLKHGLDGTELWDAIKGKVASHHDILMEMRERQIRLATYAKHRIDDGTRDADGLDATQHSLMKDIRFLETMAWRVYMFGLSNLYLARPGANGEYEKRRRTDPSYWKLRTLCGPKKADKWLKHHMRQEWERTIFRKYNY